MLVAIVASGCRERAAELLHLRGPSGPAVPPAVSDPRAIHFTFTAPDAVTFDWSGGGSTIRLWANGRSTADHRRPPAQPRPVDLDLAGPRV